jgi:hypothetical protein
MDPEITWRQLPWETRSQFCIQGLRSIRFPGPRRYAAHDSWRPRRSDCVEDLRDLNTIANVTIRRLPKSAPLNFIIIFWGLRQWRVHYAAFLLLVCHCLKQDHFTYACRSSNVAVFPTGFQWLTPSGQFLCINVLLALLFLQRPFWFVCHIHAGCWGAF